MQAVNLLPLENRPAGRWTTFGTGVTAERVFPLAAAAAGVVVLGLAGLYVLERSAVSSKEKALAAQQAQLAAVQSQAQVIKNVQADVAARSTVVDSLISGRMVWDSALGDLARVLPSGVQLSALQASAPTAVPTAPIAPTTGTTSSSTSSTSSTTTAAATPTPVAPPTTAFSITGDAPSHVTVALVLDRLSALPWLAGVSLQTSNRLSTGSVQFSVVATVAAKGGQ